jgi:hypothetical protein
MAQFSESFEMEPQQGTRMADTFFVQQMYQHNEASERENSLRLVDLLPLLREATAELRSAASNALNAITNMINFVNTTRYCWHSAAHALSEQERELDSAAERLRGALVDFKENRRLRLLEPFEPHLGTLAAPMRGLYVCYVFSASIVVVSEAILAVMDTVRQTTNKRKKNRLWAPKGLRQLVHALFVEKSAEGDPRAYGETREVKEVVPEEAAMGKYRKYCAGRTRAFQPTSHFFRARSRQPTTNKHLAKDYGGLAHRLPMDQNSKGFGTLHLGLALGVSELTTT